MKDRRGLRVNHKQVRIKHRGRDVEVDELLAPVIRDLWRQGFRTVSSCQGDPKWITGADGTRARVSLAWIGFRSMREAKRFQRAIVGGEIIVPTREDMEQAATASYEAGYYVPGMVGVTFLIQHGAPVPPPVKPPKRSKKGGP